MDYFGNISKFIIYMREKDTHQKRGTAKRSGPTSAEKIKLQFW